MYDTGMYQQESLPFERVLQMLGDTEDRLKDSGTEEGKCNCVCNCILGAHNITKLTLNRV